MRLKIKTLKPLTLTVLLIASFFSNTFGQGQSEYPSLLWKISGNGLEKPSFIFGTMHVSNKIAFRLGTPFFEALESVDVLALELEPELWFDEVLSGDFINQSMNYSYGYYGNRNWNEYESKFDIPTNYDMKVQSVFKSNPSTINSLLYRLNDFNADFEETTWLDMYIYQSARKLNKQTVGLETFKESMDMQIKSTKETVKEDEYVDQYESISYEDRMEINQKIEDAYRNGDLDMLDSLTRKTSNPGFRKYIIDERNVNFMKGVDSLLKQKSVFVAVGASHLPGPKGCIQMIRDLGYTVEPIDMGKKDAKQKKKLDQLFVKRPLRTYTSEDGIISFQSPYNTYKVPIDGAYTSLVTMDITNGLTFVVNRIMLNAPISGVSAQNAAEVFEKFMYETVPGEIVSSKKLDINGIKGYEVINETRRGDIQRNQIYFCEDEVIIARLSATGEKIKQGAGDYFFNQLKINKAATNDWLISGAKDGSMKYKFPTRPLSYSVTREGQLQGECFLQSTDEDGDYHGIFRITGSERGFLDEESYELKKLENGFRTNLELTVLDSSMTKNGDALNLFVKYDKFKGKNVFASYELLNLSYHVAFVVTDNEQKARDFFSTISYHTPKVDEKYPLVDSALFFKTQINWKQDENDFKSLMNMAMGSYGLYGDKKVNLAKSYNRSDVFTPPHSNEKIMVRYERKGKYDEYYDIEFYKENQLEDITANNDLIILDSTWIWTGNDYVAELWMTDTLSNRGYHHKRIFHNRAQHDIVASYDIKAGESDFVKMFIENFEPLEDTLNLSSYFENTKESFIADMMSEDSTVFYGAEINFKNVYHLYDVDDRLEIYKMIANAEPPLVQEEDVDDFKRRLGHYMYLDDSKEHMAQMKKEYYEFSDSADYQQIIIENLMDMETKEAWLIAKELLTDEPPIGTDVYPFDLSDRVMDSVELGTLLYPEILDLGSFDEYKYCWIGALAELVDSNAIKKEVYKSKLSSILNDAKVELKRLSSSESTNSKEENYYEYMNYYSKSNDDNFSKEYWSILFPYMNTNADVKKFFEDLKNSKKKHVQLEYAYFMHDHGVRLDDEFCKGLYSKTITFEDYKTLKDLDRLDLLPDSLDVERMIIEDDIKNSKNGYYYGDRDIDTLIPVNTYDVTIRNRTYKVFQYKYQATYRDDSEWLGVMAMVEVGSFENDDFDYIYEERVAKKDELDDEFFEDLHFELVDNNRDNRYGGYGYNKFNFSDAFSSLFGL